MQFMHTSQQRLKGRYKSRRWEIKSSDFFSFYLINEYSCMTSCSSDPSANTSNILMVKKISRKLFPHIVCGNNQLAFQGCVPSLIIFSSTESKCKNII